MAFKWSSVGHAFSALFHDVVIGGKATAKVIGEVTAQQGTIEALSSLIDPRIASVEQIAFGLLGKVSAIATQTSEAAAANGINVTLDAAEVAEIKELIADFPEILAQIKAIYPAAKTTPAPAASASSQVAAQVPAFAPKPENSVRVNP